MKICIACNKEKALTEFAQDKRASDGRRSRCKQCVNEQDKADKRAYEQKAKISKEKKMCLRCGRKRLIKYFGWRRNVCNSCRALSVKESKTRCQSLQGVSYDVIARNSSPEKYLQQAFYLAKSRAKRIGWEFTIAYKDLLVLYDRQRGKCALTNRLMTHIAGQGRIATNISIDRIDSCLGYIPDNVQLVCYVVNGMKSNLPQNEFVQLCMEVTENCAKSLLTVKQVA